MKGGKMKNLIKNNILSLIFVISLILVGGIFAGNVFVKQGDLNVDENLNASNTLFVDSADGKVGIGTSNPQREFHIATTTNLTDDQAVLWRFEHRTTGTPVANFGVNYECYLDNSINNLTEAGYFQVAWADPTSGDEDSKFIYIGKKAGIRSPLMVIDAITGLAYYGNAEFSGSGTRTLNVIRDGGTTLSLQSSTTTGGGYVRTSTQSPLYLGTNGTIAVTISSSQKVGVGTSAPGFPLTVYGDNESVTIWAEKNISATGYLTRTSVYDKSQGSALEKIKDADDYLTNGKIDHSKFYGYTNYDYKECFSDEETEFCETKTEEGVSLNQEIDLLRQAVYELKTELCTKDNSYEFC